MKEEFSKKEREYLRFLAQGMSDKEIARKIGVKTKALSSGRIFGIKAKVGVKTREEVVQYAKEHFTGEETTTMNPWAETTTVEDLLTILEAECPVGIVTNALSKKHMTPDERERLLCDLEYISQEAQDAIAAIKRGTYEKTTQTQETVLSDVQATQDGMGEPLDS